MGLEAKMSGEGGSRRVPPVFCSFHAGLVSPAILRDPNMAEGKGSDPSATVGGEISSSGKISH